MHDGDTRTATTKTLAEWLETVLASVKEKASDPAKEPEAATYREGEASAGIQVQRLLKTRQG